MLIAEVSVRWYKKWWGVGLIIALLLLVAIGISFGLLVFHYWKEIKAGRGAKIQKELQGQYSRVFPKSSGVHPVDPKKIETADDPYIGRPNAPIVAVTFIDFKCPFCRQAAPILKQVASTYGYKVKIIIRDLPVESTHPGATELAKVAYCAQKQDRFWEMYDVLYELQDTLPAPLTEEMITYLANRASVSVNTLKQCLGSNEAFQEVQADYVDGVAAGVEVTPTYFINGKKVEGVISWEAWKKYLDNVK